MSFEMIDIIVNYKLINFHLFFYEGKLPFTILKFIFILTLVPSISLVTFWSFKFKSSCTFIKNWMSCQFFGRKIHVKFWMEVQLGSNFEDHNVANESLGTKERI